MKYTIGDGKYKSNRTRKSGGYWKKRKRKHKRNGSTEHEQRGKKKHTQQANKPIVIGRYEWLTNTNNYQRIKECATQKLNRFVLTGIVKMFYSCGICFRCCCEVNVIGSFDEMSIVLINGVQW